MAANTHLDNLRMMLDVSMRAAAIGAAIARARKEKGWKQRELASQIPGRDGPIETQTVSNWERGKHAPDLETLRIIAQALGKPVAFFLEDEETTPSAASDLLAAATAQIRAAEAIEDAAGALLEAAKALEQAAEQPRRATRRRAAS